MYPLLLQLGPIKIPTYGAMMAIGFMLAFTVAAKKTQKRGYDPDAVANLFFIIVASSIIGSRALFVFLRLDYFFKHPLQAFMLWRGGLVFYGGLVTAVISSMAYCRYTKLPIPEMGDLLAPSLALGHVFGRLGCFAYGCCYGSATTLPWGVVFPKDPVSVVRHPTQLYEALAELLIFYLLSKLYERKLAAGSVMSTYVLLYSTFRFFVEFLRADYRGGTFFLGLSIAQNTALLLILGALLALWLANRNKRRKE